MRNNAKHFGASLRTLGLALSLMALPLGQEVMAKPNRPAKANDQSLKAVRARAPQDEIIYFLMTDRFFNADPSNDHGGIEGGPKRSGFDPSLKTAWHGGDLKGVTQKLDYIKNLGATAIWITPPFGQWAVENPDKMYTGFHGYHSVDFTNIDAHLGTKADFKTLIDTAHAKGLKVYVDIVINHTANIIKYKECEARFCDYRSKADYPALNTGTYAYSPYVPKGLERVKKPDWLNDPKYYHNRGESAFFGESSLLGDFSGLDDVNTDDPFVIKGMIDIYGQWIDEFGFDGYRVDTARHVQPSFWQAFLPAMQNRAKAKGIPNFHIFAEAWDLETAMTASHTRVDGFKSVLDFPFQNTLMDLIARNRGTDQYRRFIQSDAAYEGGAKAALTHATFADNHDMGRIAYLIKKARPDITEDELLHRVELALAMVMTSRGVPTIYFGTEQGFVGDGDDNDAREDMMPSKVAIYNDNDLIGNEKTTADDNFDTDTRLYKSIQALAKLRQSTPELRHGLTKVIGTTQNVGGLLAFTRQIPNQKGLVLVAMNTSHAPITANIAVPPDVMSWKSLHGPCPTTSREGGSLSVTLPAFGFVVCKAG